MGNFFSVPPLRMPIGKGNGLPARGQIKIMKTARGVGVPASSRPVKSAPKSRRTSRAI